MNNVKRSILRRVRVGDAIGMIADECDCTIVDVVDALIGVAFDEEDAGDIMEYHSSEEHEWASAHLRRGNTRDSSQST